VGRPKGRPTYRVGVIGPYGAIGLPAVALLLRKPEKGRARTLWSWSTSFDSAVGGRCSCGLSTGALSGAAQISEVGLLCGTLSQAERTAIRACDY
jgi:hypothetical protein